jgi:hypothetical protein
MSCILDPKIDYRDGIHALGHGYSKMACIWQQTITLNLPASHPDTRVCLDQIIPATDRSDAGGERDELNPDQGRAGNRAHTFGAQAPGTPRGSIPSITKAYSQKPITRLNR